MLYDTVECDMQYNTVRYNTTQCSRTQSNTLKEDTTVSDITLLLKFRYAYKILDRTFVALSERLAQGL